MVRPGYGLPAAIAGRDPGPTGPSPAGAVAPAIRRPLSRLDRRVQVRRRRRSDDEFRRAGRAELLSDDARYRVLFAITAAWYAPAALLFIVWVLTGADGEPAASRLGPGLLWIAAATGLSLSVAGLLRWATVGWRAVTLSLASAVIGGAVVAIASNLSG